MEPHKLPSAIGKTKSSTENEAAFDGDIGGSNLVRRPAVEPDEKDQEENPLVTKDYNHSHEVDAIDNNEEVESTAGSTDTASDYSEDNTTLFRMIDWIRKRMPQWTRNSISAQSPSGQITRQSLRKYINRDSSPWVLPIKVQAHIKQAERNRKWKTIEATFDTGMEQGNMASYDVVANILHNGEVVLLDLTPTEERGGICVNGNMIIPIGAIELTWKGADKGARIFRKMRFLVTEEGLKPPFQLVIGTKSLAKEKILGPPALIGASAKKIVVMPKGTREELKLADKKALLNELEAAESEAVHQKLVKEKREKQVAMRKLKEARDSGNSHQSTLESASDSGTPDSASDSGF